MRRNRRYVSVRVALALIYSLFFLWGLATNLVNALNEPFKDTLELSASDASFLQVAHYLAYFLASIPAALVARRWGYRSGIIAGLSLFAAGALATIPAVSWLSFPAFLTAMFIMAAGMATIETNASPYVTKLGNARYESLRLNVAQSFNGVGSVAGPLLASLVLAGLGTGMGSAAADLMDRIGGIYVALAFVILLVLVVFLIVRLPEPEPAKLPEDEVPRATVDTPTIEEAHSSPEYEVSHTSSPRYADLFRLPHFTWALLAAFLFIGAQVTLQSQLASFAVESLADLGSAGGARYLAIGTAIFALGRIVTSPLMATYDSGKILGTYMVSAAVLMASTLVLPDQAAVIAATAALFFLSIGFPTVYALGLRGLGGDAAKNGASLLTMSLVGGAIIPYTFGRVADLTSISTVFAIVSTLLLVVAWFGFRGSRL